MADKIRIAVLDDDENDLKRVKAAFEKLGEADAEYFSDAAELLRAAERPPAFDIAFLDVYLPNGTGIDAAEKLREISAGTDLVFITGSREHAVEAFRLKALHYLVKPVTEEGVEEALRRREEAKGGVRASLTFKINRESYRVYLDEIVSIQSFRHAVEISLSGGRSLRVWTSISEIEQMVDGNFLKINRGTIINMNEVSHMDVDTCCMSDGSRLPISKKKHMELREKYNDFLTKELHVIAASRRWEKK